MSKQSQLNTLKKEDLINKIVEMEENEKVLIKQSNVESTEKDVQSLTDSVSMADILEQNRQLKEELSRRKATEKFVFVECQSKGRVWLAAPESRSGAPEDREKGRMLKGNKDFAIIPSYWMLDFISRRTQALVDGGVIINNERGRSLNPNIEFVDFDLPDDFLKSAIKNAEIEKVVIRGDNSIYDFIKKHGDNRAILGRTKGIVDSFTEREEKKPEKERSESLISFLTGVSIYIDEVLSPNKEAELKATEKREELLLKTV